MYQQPQGGVCQEKSPILPSTQGQKSSILKTFYTLRLQHKLMHKIRDSRDILRPGMRKNEWMSGNVMLHLRRYAPNRCNREDGNVLVWHPAGLAMRVSL